MHRPFLLGASALAFALSAAGAQRPARAPRHGADSLTFTPQLGAPALPADGGRPAISAVGELVADLSPDGSTQPDSARFGVRTVELGLQSTLERRLRATIFVSANDRQRVTIDEATLGTDALPWGVRLRLGRALMPVGKENTEHRHDLHTVEYPYVVQRFLQADGLRGTGIAASKAFAPFGFQQELTVSWVDRFGDAIDSLTTREPASRYVDGMGYAARLRNYWTLARDADFELSGSAVTGRRPTSTGFTDPHGVDAVNARQTVVGADATLRWRSADPARPRSFLLQGELMRQLNDRSWLVNPQAAAAPVIRDYDGGYVYARWQLSERWYAGGRFDSVQDPTALGARLNAGSAVFEWFPVPSAKVLASYERRQVDGRRGEDRILFAGAFALGPHRPHRF